MNANDLLGKIEYSDNNIVKGWALSKSQPDEPITVAVFEGDTEIEKFTPCLFRWDLKEEGYGRGYHGFVYKIPSEFQDGRPHELSFVFEDGTVLEGSPVIINHDPDSDFVISSAQDLTGRKVLALSATPDGGILGAGGALALHAISRDTVKVIFIGNFRKNESGEDEKAIKSCSILGLKDLEFWSSSTRTFSPEPEDVDRLSELLSDYKPELIYCPSPHEPGPREKALAATLWRAIQKSGISCEVAFTEVKSPIRINTLIDITTVVNLKKEALSACETHNTDTALGLNQFRSNDLSSESTYAEGLFLIDSYFIQSSPVEGFSNQQFYSAAGLTSVQNPPLVSIMIRTMNREPLLREALSSVVMQTYPNIEVVLVNDGNNDLTELVEEFRKYIDIQYINPQERQGAAKAANLGLRAARGEFINILDDDDLLYSGHVAKLTQFLYTTGQRAASTDVEHGTYELTDSGFKLVGEKIVEPGIEHDPVLMMVWCYTPPITIMFRKSVLEEIGYMDEEFTGVGDDWELWLRLLQRVLPKRLPGVTCEHRTHADHNHDYTNKRIEVFEKHKQHFENGNIDLSLLNRIDKLVEENGYLRKRLSKEYFYPDYVPPRSQTVWKILYRIKKILPNKVVEYIQSKGYRL